LSHSSSYSPNYSFQISSGDATLFHFLLFPGSLFSSLLTIADQEENLHRSLQIQIDQPLFIVGSFADIATFPQYSFIFLVYLAFAFLFANPIFSFGFLACVIFKMI